ncbi:MAG: (d)CMP kinase [Clostridiales bacterium]|nr:(d)CMP kinase [Clostridiales bacterium]
MLAIRGAITVNNNTKPEILDASRMLLTEIITQNGINVDDIVSVIYTATQDLDQVYPAAAARDLGLTMAGLMCYQEMLVRGSLQKCLRCMVLANIDRKQSEARHVYLRGAITLRPDLISPDETKADEPNPVVPDPAESDSTAIGIDKVKSDRRERFVSIAIDGPSGVGKSTLAKALAKDLAFVHVDTGALYRAITLHCLNKGVKPEHKKTVVDVLSAICIEILYKDDIQRVILNGEDVTDRLRSPKISKATSRVAAIPEVRAKLLDLQRNLAHSQNVVMDGRDIGTKILPRAQVKIFLDASVHSRTLRRMCDLPGSDYDIVKRELEARDRDDLQRSVAPLKKAPDATYIDTTNKNFDEVFERALSLIKDRLRNHTLNI